jgi:hypothetical protein
VAGEEEVEPDGEVVVSNTYLMERLCIPTAAELKNGEPIMNLSPYTKGLI